MPSTSAITQARQRLGAGPLRELFHRAAVPVAGLGATGAWLRGRRLMAIDGTSFDVPDTAGNAAAFHKMGSGPKESAFPRLQVVSLSECGTHARSPPRWDPAAPASASWLPSSPGRRMRTC